MINLLLSIIKDMTIYVGYIKNNTYLNPLSEDEEDIYVNDWLKIKIILVEISLLDII